MIRRIYKYFQDLNLFKLETIQLDDFDRPVYIVATRLYIAALVLALILLTCFVALDDQNNTITIRNPSQATFLELEDRYSSTLSCPCRKITIPFGSFTSITTTYHPICNSIFVSDQWINLIFNPNISLYYPLDFRSTALGHFQLLSSFCSLARRFVNDAIDDFSTDTLLTQVVLSKKSLDLKIQSLDGDMQISMFNSFRQILELMRKATFSNQLQTALQTSVLQAYYGYYVDEAANVIYEGSFSDGSNSTCRCGAVSTCTSSKVGFFDIIGMNTRGEYVSYDSLVTNITGFIAGCYPIESLLKSTLDCLFDHRCILNILEYFWQSNSTNFNSLNSSQTKFSPQSTVNSLLDNLLVENWSVDVSFDNYYDECAAILCTYILSERASLLYIITQLLGFYGGLTIALRLLIPKIVLNVFKRLRPRLVQVAENERPFLLLEKIRLQIIELNLFKTRDERNNLYDLNTSRMTTRIFLILTSVCVVVLSIYTATMIRSQTIVIHDPSEATCRDLHSKYSNTLRCPCDSIAVEYDMFTNLSPRYHSVCSSQFISSAWIDSMSTANWIDEFFDVRDFRVNGQVSFSSLSTLCNLIQLTVSNSWFVFKQSSIISEQLLSDKQLIIRVTDAINQFQSETITDFKRVLRIIQFQASTLFASGSQNYAFPPQYLSNSTQSIEFYTKPSLFGNCSCALNDRCSTPVGFYNISGDTDWLSRQSRYDIPQFFAGCFVLQSILQSSLECFFNQTCLDMIQVEIISPKSINISILQSNHSRFQPETLVGDLVDELMIEDWGESINYSNYYAQCRPKQCSYTINSRSSISYIITAVIGLCGGVIAALKIIVPIFVRSLREKCRPKLENELAPPQLPTLMDRFHQILRSIYVKISKINLFETELSWDDPEREHHEIIVTRVHLFLLAIALFIMIFYTTFSMKTQTIMIDHPSESLFEQLQSNDEFLSTLYCPCQNITIPYHSFTSISFRFHQLCSSDLIQIDSMWTNTLYTVMITERHTYDDYRMFVLLHFRLLSSLCQLADDIVTDGVQRFHMNELITDQAEFRDAIVLQTNAALAQLRSIAARNFARTLDFTRSLTQGNGIISATLSNWYYMTFDRINFNTIWTFPRSYDYPSNCSCATSSMCTSLATINNIVVPGFRVGCYALDSLLQSTLECLYDHNCLAMIQSLNSSMNFTITPLNSSLSSPNSTVQSLIDELLIAEWNTNVSYEKYYESCAPLFCSYSINQRADLIYIVTASIGFYGGLSTAIRIIAPMMAKIGQSIWMFYQTRCMRRNGVVPINR